MKRIVPGWIGWPRLDLPLLTALLLLMAFGLVVLYSASGADSGTVLRQAVRYCVESEQHRIRKKRPEPAIRAVLPKLLDQYRLLAKPVGDRKADDAWAEKMCATIVNGTREQAAEAVAAALAEGMSPEAIGEAMSLASNQLVLRDPGRKKNETSPGKPEGSIHGASVGVHASDSAIRGELRHVLLGTGITPYPALFKQLKQAGWDGWICMEEASYQGPPGVEVAAQFIRQTWEHS